MKKIVILTSAVLLLGAGCATQTSSITATPSTSSPTTTAASVTIASTLPIKNPNTVIPKEIPTLGPYVHSVWSASSTDGKTFINDFTDPLVEHASVPTALQFPDGTIRTYFVDVAGQGEKFSCIQSVDNGATYTWGNCTLTGLSSERAVDYSVVALPDGRYRLYYYAVTGKVDSKTSHNINSAISTDGVTFAEERVVFTYDGLVDPDVFWNGTEWVMHVFTNSEMATVVATSADGTSFTYQSILSPEKYGVTKPVTLTDGTFRMYGFKQPWASQFYSMVSADGLTWALESGTRFTTVDDTLITDPFVILLTNGTYKMFYKLEPSAGRNAAE